MGLTNKMNELTLHILGIPQMLLHLQTIFRFSFFFFLSNFRFSSITLMSHELCNPHLAHVVVVVVIIIIFQVLNAEIYDNSQINEQLPKGYNILKSSLSLQDSNTLYFHQKTNKLNMYFLFLKKKFLRILNMYCIYFK